MFGRLTKELTEYSNHYIDWSRVGELVGSGRHRYSRDELLVRAGIILSTVISGFLGVYFNDEENTHCSSLTMGIISSLAGFTISHAIVLYPLVSKRWAMSRECDDLVDQVEEKLNDDEYDENSKNRVCAIISTIRQHSLSTDEHGNASLTWGWRKRLLNNLLEYITQNGSDAARWSLDDGAVIETLDNFQVGHTISRPGY